MNHITFTPDQEKVFEDAINVYGEDSQLTQTNEELTELSLAILKYKRAIKKGDSPEIIKRKHELISEIADVIVMTQQCLLIFNADEVQQEINYKLRRQRRRIDKKLGKEYTKETHFNYISGMGIGISDGCLGIERDENGEIIIPGSPTLKIAKECGCGNGISAPCVCGKLNKD